MDALTLLSFSLFPKVLYYQSDTLYFSHLPVKYSYQIFPEHFRYFQNSNTLLVLPPRPCLHHKLGETAPPGKGLLTPGQNVSPQQPQTPLVLWECGSLQIVCSNPAICTEGTLTPVKAVMMHCPGRVGCQNPRRNI